ncbi:MAG: STAS domain-containing protein [Phycisphaerae bacterium]
MMTPTGSPTLLLTGARKIVAAVVPDIRASWLAQVDSPGKRVYADLRDVVMIDSCGLGLLVEMLTMLKRQGREFAIVAPSQHVQTVLSVTRLDKAFAIVDAIHA